MNSKPATGETIEIMPILDDDAALTALLTTVGKELVFLKVSNPDCHFDVTVRYSKKLLSWGAQAGFGAEHDRWDSVREMTRVLRDCATPVFREIQACRVGNAPINLQRFFGSSFFRIYLGDEYNAPNPDQITQAVTLLKREVARCAVAMAHFYTATNAIVFGTCADCVAEITARFNPYLGHDADALEAMFLNEQATRQAAEAFQNMVFLAESADELTLGDRGDRTVN